MNARQFLDWLRGLLVPLLLGALLTTAVTQFNALQGQIREATQALVAIRLDLAGARSTAWTREDQRAFQEDIIAPLRSAVTAMQAQRRTAGVGD